MGFVQVGSDYFRKLVIPGDGDCLFSSISQGLYSTIGRSFEVRLNVVDYVCDNWEELQCMTSTAGPGNPPFGSVDVYRSEMSKSGTFGDAAELTATARIYDAYIRVVEDDGQEHYFGAPGFNLIVLHFDRIGAHYSLLEECVEEPEGEGGAGDGSEDDTPAVPDRSSDADSSSDDESPIPGSDGECGAPPQRGSNREEDMSFPGWNGRHRRFNVDVDDVTDHPLHCDIRIGSSLLRQYSVVPLASRITQRHSLELPAGTFRESYLWGYVYQSESHESIDPLDLGPFSSICEHPSCGAVFWDAEHLAGQRRHELPSWCCGKTVKSLIPATGLFKPIEDEAVRNLFYGASDDAKHFRQYIRPYNFILSVAIPSVGYDKTKRSESTVTVNGKVTFNAPSCPNIQADGLPLHHGQLYFLDMTQDTLRKRLASSTCTFLRLDILALLERYLRDHNALVQTFMQAGEVQRELELEPGGNIDVHLVVNPHRKGFRVTERELFSDVVDLHRPANSECVAAVFLGSELSYHYDMVFHPRRRAENDAKFMVINESSPTLDMMLYPLIHLHAEDPWVEISDALGGCPGRGDEDDDVEEDAERPCKRRKVQDKIKNSVGTLRQYYSARIMWRSGRDSGVLFRCRGLYQQWLLEGSLKIMDANLRYAKENQKELQVCEYDSLQQYVESVAEDNNKRPGRPVILPPFEQRSERSMNENYLNSVRLALEFSPPSFFLTFTVNPRWPEIKCELARRGLSSDEYMHAPDIVVRSFLARLNVFISDVVHKSIFGRVTAYVGVTEFTSTMLPHYHLSVMMHPTDRVVSAEQVDAITSAEIPDIRIDPEGQKLVMALMIHRPCDGSSPHYPNPPCRPGGVKCKHNFPKKFCEASRIASSGPVLRRRKTAPVRHAKYGCFVDNRWVVEFNIRLLKRHVNHINVRHCGNNIWFKYLFSYMQKESNGQHVQGAMLKYALNNSGEVLEWDEIEAFQRMRCVGPYEAVYRILGRSFVQMSHTVFSMPIHMPGKQYVYYAGRESVAAGRPPNSKLMAYFELNKKNPVAQGLLYQDLMTNFKWFTKRRERADWVQLKYEKNSLGRLMHVNPSLRNLELFHLRLLLLQVRGAISFGHLKTVDGKYYNTFKEACAAQNILWDDYYCYADALKDVASHANAWQMRNFFACLIVHCGLQHISQFWIAYRASMSADYVRQDAAVALLWARREVLRIIADMETQGMDDVASQLTVPGGDGMQQEVVPAQDVSFIEGNSGGQCDESDCSDSSFAADDGGVEAHILTLNAEQRSAHDAIMESVLHAPPDQANIMSLMAPAGTGKTHVYIGVIKDCKERGISVIATAFTAIAALLLPDGETCHRAFGIPIRARTDGSERSFIEAGSEDGARLSRVGLVLVDECSMLSKWQVILMDHLFRTLMGRPDIPFGGKPVLFGGDMAQILPVLPGCAVGDVSRYCIVAWEHWHKRRAMTLTVNMRAEQDPVFAAWVERVRDGSANIPGTENLAILPDLLVNIPKRNKNVLEEDQLMDETITKVFGDMKDLERVRNGVIVAPTNRITRELNSKMLARLEGPATVYYAKTSITLDDKKVGECDFILPPEELNAIEASNIPPHELRLKVGCTVMLLLNMNKKQGLCNGTRFTVTKMTPHFIQVKRIVPFKGQLDEIMLPRMRLKSDDIPVAGTVHRFQFPVRLAFAITINKSQGQSIEYVGVYLERPVFAHGQFYVAVSRGKKRANVWVAVLRGNYQGKPDGLRGTKSKKKPTLTKNIVIKSLLV